MNISAMNEQIDIKTTVLTKDALGGNSYVDTTTFANIWCNVKVWKGNTNYSNKQQTADLLYMITIRYRLGVSPVMVVYYKGDRLLIESVKDIDTKHEFIEMTCRSIKNTGV